ncbi:MAG TPA: PQQ-binding-like beta-propeller repeat protein [Candidatus Cybelea sp.]|nr:PQQ-binding-like beta-propeller repeat protein [Candidatus Cybelea sp.]
MSVSGRSLFASASLAALGMALMLGPVRAQGVDANTLMNADKDPNNWVTYHGSYKSWHYSGLKQITTENVKNLRIAWIHQETRSTRGIQSMPLAYNGVLYYSGSYSKVTALNGATGEQLWAYTPKLDEELVARQTHSPYNRGMAMGLGNLYIGTVDGRLIALDMKTGKPVWETKLVNSQKLTVGFTGAPLFVKDKVIIGSQGGEWPGRGPIFGVDAKTGKKLWEFLTVAGTDEAMKTWGNESWRTGGGGGWMPGTYDAETNTIWWGTANPAPLYDWGGSDWKTKGARPGDNLYTTSVIGLDPDTGKLKFYHQELPHDAWDFDSAVGEFVAIDRGGKKYYVHPNKGGFIFVYDRANAKVENVYKLADNINFVKDITKTGELVGRRDLPEGPAKSLCPAIAGGISWNSGSYNPGTGLYYKIANEWCMDLTVQKTTPVTEPQAQLNIAAEFTLVNPPNGKAHGHLDARDPITGKLKWKMDFPEPPLASLLSTAGNLVFVPDMRGWLHAVDARNGKDLWKGNDGAEHNGGIISYMADGKQYVAVVTGGPSLVGEGYGPLFGGQFGNMPKDTGSLIVYSLK